MKQTVTQRREEIEKRRIDIEEEREKDKEKEINKNKEKNKNCHNVTDKSNNVTDCVTLLHREEKEKRRVEKKKIKIKK